MGRITPTGLMRAGLVRAGALAVVLAAGVAVPVGCRKSVGIARTPDVVLSQDDRIFNATLGASATLANARPVLASGIGFVVGLNGTGGRPLREDIAATMTREMQLLGLGSAGNFERFPGINNKSPDQVLRDPNTAVVIVQAVVPPGAPPGSSFDVFVQAENAESLEGGTLWTTDLFLGPPRLFNDIQAVKLGEARGPIFVNPFVEEAQSVSGLDSRFGRVLDGGRIVERTSLEVRLDRESHEFARQVTFAINSRFPEQDGDGYPTARGRDASSVSVTVPSRWRDRAGEFVDLLEHLTVDVERLDSYQRRYARGMRDQPYLADRLSLCLEAIGEPALPTIRAMYGDLEFATRTAALRAGAALNDPNAIDPLLELIDTGPESERPGAIRLLARIRGGRGVNTFEVDLKLRELLEEPSLPIRIAAYEGLIERAVAARRVTLEAAERSKNASQRRLTTGELDLVAQASLPSGTVRGVSRSLMDAGFFLDRVPGGAPMIYITQQREPRIAIFGETATLARPIFVEVPRVGLMLAAEAGEEQIRIRYRMRSGGVVTTTVEDDLFTIVRLLARDPVEHGPTRGFGLNYTDVVATLHMLQRTGAFRGSFATEQNRLMAELIRAREEERVELRPGTEDEDPDLVIMDPIGELPSAGAPAGEPVRARGLMQPIERESE